MRSGGDSSPLRELVQGLDELLTFHREELSKVSPWRALGEGSMGPLRIAIFSTPCESMSIS